MKAILFKIMVLAASATALALVGGVAGRGFVASAATQPHMFRFSPEPQMYRFGPWPERVVQPALRIPGATAPLGVIPKDH